MNNLQVVMNDSATPTPGWQRQHPPIVYQSCNNDVDEDIEEPTKPLRQSRGAATLTSTDSTVSMFLYTRKATGQCIWLIHGYDEISPIGTVETLGDSDSSSSSSNSVGSSASGSDDDQDDSTTTTPTNLRCKKVYFPMAASRYYYYSYYTTKACSITATSIPVIQPPWRQRSS